MTKVAVLLSGCGVFDGSEIHESVLTLLHLEKAGVEVQCFAPERNKTHVINHTKGEESDQSRCILQESGRIARGNVKSLSALDDSFDALIIPGGFGVAKNFCDFAFKGADFTVQQDAQDFIESFTKHKKPVGFMCISPILMPKFYGAGIKGTIGNCPDTAKAFTHNGGVHQDAAVNEIVIDHDNNAVSTPAYMYDAPLSEIEVGISKLVHKVVELCS